VRDAGGGKVNLVNSSSGKCVDINGSGSADGTKVQLWGCNGTGAQSFELRSNGAIVNSASGKCLDVAGNGTADYTVVHLWTCHGGANQQWTRQ
jgi:DnaJ-class molecular chaperone